MRSTPITEDLLAPLRQTLEAAMADHERHYDGWLYNGGTVVALVATTTATVLPSVSGIAKNNIWIIAVCSGVATLLVSLERALRFGERWAYHSGMKARYRFLLDSLVVLFTLTQGEQTRAFRNLMVELRAVRLLESALPGVRTHPLPPLRGGATEADATPPSGG
jgi:hypothetical protein